MDSIDTGTGRTRVGLTWQRWGDDLHVHIAAGQHHLGAVALVGREAGGKVCANAFRVPPHREDDLALDAAKMLHAASGSNVCVTAGIHLDRITPAEIEAVLENVKNGIAVLARRLQAK